MNAQEEWEKLFMQMAENLFWAEAQSKALLEEQPVGGSLARVQEQTNFVQVLFRSSIFFHFSKINRIIAHTHVHTRTRHTHKQITLVI